MNHLKPFNMNTEYDKDLFRYLVNDICESLYWEDKLWELENPRIQDLYESLYDEETDMIYYCLDWMTLDDEDKELWEMGKAEDLKDIWEDALNVSRNYKRIEQLFFEKFGYCSGQEYMFSKFLKIDDEWTLIGIHTQSEGAPRFIGLYRDSCESEHIILESPEEYQIFFDAIDGNFDEYVKID